MVGALESPHWEVEDAGMYREVGGGVYSQPRFFFVYPRLLDQRKRLDEADTPRSAGCDWSFGGD